MNNVVVSIARAGMNALYLLMRATHRRRNEVALVSRQADEPSYDFRMIAQQFRDAGWKATFHVRKIRASGGTGSQTGGAGMVAYAGHVLRELALLSRCRVVVLDRYDPVVGMLNFTCANAPALPSPNAQGNEAGVLHREFPTEPVVVQMWHAFGAFKKFGYQSAGGREGHALSTLKRLNIHRNYTWVLCSGEAARQPFADAFAYPIERVVAFARPSYLSLKEEAGRLAQAGAAAKDADAQRTPTVLVAPTVRMSAQSPHPLHELRAHADSIGETLGARLSWSAHPLEMGLPAPGGTNPQLIDADVVVTDYSSIVYEAYLLGKPVVFFVADYDAYCETPGLNADPMRLCPQLCARTEDELKGLLAQALSDPEGTAQLLEPFAAPAFEGADTAYSDLPLLLARK
ncbi:MAG: CDP-glycerol glycerophosphotransferase family protein [Eggerthellaceae bacterium]|nr:CDP-glycerol glycerophosphotransferase family protein [Eggerthellaceae bacterium]